MYWQSSDGKQLAQGKGQGKPEKSTGPPRPASASRRLIMTAIAASSFPSLVVVVC